MEKALGICPSLITAEAAMIGRLFAGSRYQSYMTRILADAAQVVQAEAQPAHSLAVQAGTTKRMHKALWSKDQPLLYFYRRIDKQAFFRIIAG